MEKEQNPEHLCREPRNVADVGYATGRRTGKEHLSATSVTCGCANCMWILSALDVGIEFISSSVSNFNV